MAVDLLRPALRQSGPRLTGARVAVAASIAVSALVLALILAIGIQWFGERRVLAAYEVQIAALQPQWTELRTQTQQIRPLRRDVSALRTALAAPQWIDVFEAVRAAMPSGLWLFKVSAAETGALEVTVRTSQTQAVPLFLQRLQATPGLRDVRLVQTETVQTGAAEVSQATIAAQVEMP